ncbi:MAG: hypothetical protein WCR52_08990 [Bacteroidota bacterium]
MDAPLFDRMLQYRNRQMPEAERSAFEAQLKNDPAFAEEFATWAAIYTGIQEKGDETLDRELFALGKKLLAEDAEAPNTIAPQAPNLKARRVMLPRWAYAVAAFALLLLLAWPVYQRLNSPENAYASAETLFSEHFQQPSAPVVRDAAAEPWRDAYTQKHYPEAIAALEQRLADPNFSRRSEANLFLGLAYLGTKNAPKAIAAFQQVSPDSFEFEDAQWFQALALLQSGDIHQARILLQTIASHRGTARQAEAAQMLKQIK